MSNRHPQHSFIENKIRPHLSTIIIGVIISVIGGVIVVVIQHLIFENTSLTSPKIQTEQKDKKTNHLLSDTVFHEQNPQVSNTKTQPKSQHIPNTTSLPIEVNNNNKIVSTVIENYVFDTKGIGLANVKVWCENCTSRNTVNTNDDGHFKLTINHPVRDNINDQIIIKFQYNGQIDSRIVYYRDLSFETVKFKR